MCKMPVLLDIIKLPYMLKAKKHLFLLSHMRAYTSLLGHILGSHPEIEGYYEMHIGYYGWKSLLRQRQLYYREHNPKDGAKFIFDKVLHNEHHVAVELLNRENVIPFFALRAPEECVASIVSHYRKVNAAHRFCGIDFAVAYYIDRLNYLAELSKEIDQGYLYLDARCLVVDPYSSLNKITSYLGLATPLTSEYRKMDKTGKGNFGDHSSELLSGSIQKQTDKRYGSCKIPDESLLKAQDVFSSCRETLMSNSRLNILL